MRDSGTEQHDTVVIGAGQAGLAVGYHLARRGVPSVIVDANQRVGEPWRQRWDSLRLFTPARFSSLPGMRFPLPAHVYPTRDQMADYLEEYVRRFDLPVRTGVRVDRLGREADRFVLSCGGDRMEAANVVVATGAYRTPRVPTFAGALDPGITQLHSCQYQRPDQLPPGPVLVVGAANSGAELALEAARHGHRTWLSGRQVGQETPWRPGSVPDRVLTPVAWLVLSRLLTTATPMGRAVRRKFQHRGTPLVRVRLKDLDAAGVEQTPRVTGVHAGQPVLDGGRVLEVSTVLWCTGYRPDYSWIDLPVTDDDGFAVHRRGVVASVPGLYFVGQFFLHALTSSLIGGVGRDAGHVARHLALRPRAGAAGVPGTPEHGGVAGAVRAGDRRRARRGDTRSVDLVPGRRRARR